MRYIFILSVLASSLFSFSANAQEKLFLTKKSDPLVFAPLDYSKPVVTTTVVPSVSNDKKYLSIALTRNKIDNSDIKNMKMTYNSLGILIDMERGEFVKKIKNSSLYFDKNKLLKFDFGDLWDNPFPIADATKNLTSNRQSSIVDPITLQPVANYNLPASETYTGSNKGYIQTTTSVAPITQSLYRQGSNGLTLVGRFSIGLGAISEDGTKISGTVRNGTESSMVVYDIQSNQLINEIKLEAGVTPISSFVDANNHLIIYYLGKYDVEIQKLPKGIRIIDLNSSTTLKDYPNKGGFFVVNDGGTLITVFNDFGEVTFLDLNTLEFVGSDHAFHRFKNDPTGGNSIPVKIGNGNYVIAGHSSGISKLISTKQMRVIADIYVDENDWAIVAADGRVDGTAGAFQKLEWRQYDANDKVVKRSSLDMLFANFFTPGLLPQLLEGEVGDATSLLATINNAPSVKITTPANNFKSPAKEVEVTVVATDHGDPIKDIELYVNGKLFGGTERGFKVISGEKSKTFTISLVVGSNVIAAKAISQGNIESPMDRITVFYEGQKANSNLIVLAVGLDSYLNPTYNLNYAVADAKAIVEKLKTSSGSIFNQVFIHELYNKGVNKAAVVNKLKEIQFSSKPEDVFVFFYAGHGVMSEGAQNDFYLAFYDVTQLYGKDELLKAKGLSAEELKELTSSIHAQKQLIILDACQSGAAVQTFASRGAAEEKAIIQLARSSGAVLLASTGSEQFATEFAELGHGVFTYALLNGMSGQADGRGMDKKITVKELEAYINDKIPELSNKYHGQPQFPRSWSIGQDFPLLISN